ncbi:MAG: alpha/beta hydrolase [Oscillospiraceae bacterium]
MEVHVNGIDLFYEKSGDGPPIILLHGNGETHEIFDVLTKSLEKNFSVYSVDSRRHGKSTRGCTLSYELMANDIAQLIEKLCLEKPVIYGFSDGGIIGLLLAIEHGELVGTIIASGANATPNGLKRSLRAYLKVSSLFKKSPLTELMLSEPNISADELRKIKNDVVLLAGQRDLILQKHTRYIASNIKGCRVQILPKENHSSYIVHSQKLYDILAPYILNRAN